MHRINWVTNLPLSDNKKWYQAFRLQKDTAWRHLDIKAISFISAEGTRIYKQPTESSDPRYAFHAADLPVLYAKSSQN